MAATRSPFQQPSGQPQPQPPRSARPPAAGPPAPQPPAAPAPPQPPASPQPPAPPLPAPPRPGALALARTGLTRRAQASTPQLLALAMVVLVVASLAWGAVSTWTVTQHASAAADVVTVSEPLSADARQLYQSLSDADVTATTAFLSGASERLTVRQHYQADIAQAGADLSALTTASRDDPKLTASVRAVASGLPVYTGYVSQAQSDQALGYQLTGGSFMQVASEQMHLTLLPAARQIYALQNADLTARSAQATGLPWVIVSLLLSVCLGAGLYRAQRWLSRRTRRTFNLGLVAASAALTVTSVWLLAAFAVARSDVGSAEAHGSAPAEALAQATISIQAARGDEILNLISRSGSTSFKSDFTAAQAQVGPGAGSLLTAAASASQGSSETGPVLAAERDARGFYTAGNRVFSLDLTARYAAETKAVIGAGQGSSAADFSALESDLARGISADQAVFSAGASAGSGAFGGLAVALAIAAVLMACGSVWGLARRLGEYR